MAAVAERKKHPSSRTRDRPASLSQQSMDNLSERKLLGMRNCESDGKEIAYVSLRETGVIVSHEPITIYYKYVHAAQFKQRSPRTQSWTENLFTING